MSTSRTSRLKNWLRRSFYVFTILLLVWVVALQSGCLAMRTPDSEWLQKVEQNGQTLTPRVFDIKEPGGRTMHALGIEPSDSLPVILFVHGSPGSSDAFLSYLSDTILSQHARLYSVDRPGFGFTSGFGKPEPSIHAQADAVFAVLDSVAPGEKALLVGHSLGAPVVACMAMHHPDRIGGVVMIGGSIDPKLEPDPWWQPVVHAPPMKWLIPRSLWTSNAEIMPLREELESMLPHWGEIKCPTAMIHAYNDRLVPFGNVQFAKKMLINSSDYRELIFEEGDHFVVWSEQAAVRGLIMDMIGEMQ
ncbi:MAG: alpha/beta hydrolase [Saprospiraceae bacterium]